MFLCIRCLIFIDASHVAQDDAQRKRGRAAKGQPAISQVYTCSGGELVSVMGAFNVDGFVMGAVDVVVSAQRLANPDCVHTLKRCVFVYCRLAVSTLTCTTTG